MNEVVHEQADRRFVLCDGGAEVVLVYRPVDDLTVDFISTYTPPELRGRGLARRVVEAALQWAETAGLKVIPTCSYVARLIAGRQPGHN